MEFDAIGFNSVKNFFGRVIKEQGLSHAYLFYGQEMIGKKTFAIELAGKLTGNDDILMVEAVEGTISIDQIRELKHFLALRPNRKYRVAIVDGAQKMTTEAQQALLKVLEEPPVSSLIVLVSAFPAQLLGTIRSRCQAILFEPHTKKDFEQIWKQYKLTTQQQDFLFAYANGRIGLVLDLLENKKEKEIKSGAQELAKLQASDMNYRFDVAQKIVKEKDPAILHTKLLQWMLYLHTKVNSGNASALRALLDAQRYITSPYFSKQLILEHFMIKL